MLLSLMTGWYLERVERRRCENQLIGNLITLGFSIDQTTEDCRRNYELVFIEPETGNIVDINDFYGQEGIEVMVEPKSSNAWLIAQRSLLPFAVLMVGRAAYLGIKARKKS